MMMKQFIIRIATLFVFAASLMGCAKEDPIAVDNQNSSEITLRLVQTRTVADGNGIKWAKGDKVNLFHAEAGTENFISDGPFEFTGNNTFKGFIRENSVKDGKKYDWYVLYPYDENMASPKAAPIHIPADQYQSKDGDMKHLSGSYCPMAGKAANIAAGSAIEINMKHLVTVLQIKVTNYEENPMDLNLVSFRANGGIHVNETVNIINGDNQTITGSFEVDITGNTFIYNHVNKELGSGTSRPLLHLETPKSLGLNESATVYMVTLPFYIPNASTLTVGMNNNSGGITQGIYGKNVSFKAGQICKVRQGSRIAPPFKDGINFYHGKKNSDGTYSFQDGWWRCDLPADFQFSDEFSFADLFYTFNTGDANIKLHAIENQNDKAGNAEEKNNAKWEELSSCIKDNFKWIRKKRFNHNFIVDYSDKSGLFFNCNAGHNVGRWDIWFRHEDPIADLIKPVNGDILMETTPTINGGTLWGNKFAAPTAVYGGISAGTEINICSFYNSNPGSWDADMFNIFYPNWTSMSVTAANGEVILYNDGQNIQLTEYAKKFCKNSSGLTWVPAWYRGYDKNVGEYTEEAAWDGGAKAAEHGLSITTDGRLVAGSNYDGFGFRFAPSLYFEYDYGYAQHVGTKYLPFVVGNI